MRGISNLVSGYVRTFHLTAVGLLSLILVFGGDPVTNRTSGAIVTVLYFPFYQLLSTVSRLTKVAEKNEQLQLELGEANLRLARLPELERENDRLRNILNFEPLRRHNLLQARVLSVAGATTPVSAVISRGRRDSVEVDMAIINQQGLIGRVVQVAEDHAKIQLLTDPTHRVAARVAESREMGIVRFRVGRGMILDNFPIQGSIKAGDEILSSGLGGIYPAGLMVGVVTSVARSEEDAFCTVNISPAANFNRLEELFVLKESRP